MAIINLVSWSPQGNPTIYAHRYPHTNLSTYTQLIVYESQEAVFFSKGQKVGKFGPGKYTLNTENLPILRSLFGIPFGGKNPFTAEIWFVNKLQPYTIDWVIDKMPVHDIDYNTQLPLVASGRYALKIIDAEKFLLTIVGSKNDFTEKDLTNHFFGEFSTKAKSIILQYMIKNRIGYKTISAAVDDISDFLKTALKPFWIEFGLELTKFSVTSIDIDRTTEDGRRVAEAISRQSSMAITGHTWQQEEMFGVANNAFDSIGGGNGGLIGGLMAINMMGGMGGSGGVGGGMMNPQFQHPSFGGSNQNLQGGVPSVSGQQPQQSSQTREVYCSNCAKKFPSTHRFCPHCGDPYNPCPKCGTDNDQSAKRCVSCGALLQAETTTCPGCNAPLTPGSAFCGNCGQQLLTSDSNCSRCGTPLAPNIKFCPKCGNKRNTV